MRNKTCKNINNYFGSSLRIDSFRQCNGCPIRVFSKPSDNITFGIGNIYTDTIIILPSYDINKDNNVYKIVKDLYREITGLDIESECYITRYIKCYHNSSYNIDDIAAEHCFIHIIYEIGRIKPKRIISCCPSYNYLLTNNNIGHYSVGNPNVIFTNNTVAIEKFKEKFAYAITHDC